MMTVVGSESEAEKGLEPFLGRLAGHLVAKLPLVAEGQKIYVDKKALESVLPQWLEFNQSRIPLEKHAALKENILNEFNRVAGSLPFDAAELDQEAAETQRTILMALPENQARGRDHKHAVEMFIKWLCIRHALTKAGARVEIKETQPGDYRGKEVYTRDRYVMINGTAYLPDINELKKMIEMGETREYMAPYKDITLEMEAELKERSVKTVVARGAWFEGGNTIRHFGSKTLFFGTSKGWSTTYSAQNLLKAINATQDEPWNLVTVPLTNMRMYHLDTGMSEELARGHVMISPLVTDKTTYQQIVDIIGAEKIIELSREEANVMSTNMINVGSTLVMTGNSDTLREKLAAKNYKAAMPGDYGQDNFEFGAGGVHCMTNDVPSSSPRRPRQPAVMRF